MTTDLLAALDDDQRLVATHLRGPLCVLAGAGTGKTRAITYRIAYGIATGVYRPNYLLAVTFTARAAGELRSRLRDLRAHGVQARTFHAAALRQLTYFWPRVFGGGVPRIQEHKAGLVAEAASRLGLGVDRPAIRDLAAEIEWAKVSMFTPQEYPKRAAADGRADPAGFDHATVASLAAMYEEVKTEQGVIDFEDVLLTTVGILQEREDVASEVRAQYRHFIVDEYQDVSPLQQTLLDLWLGDRSELCVVGDVSQTIYSFTGATPTYLSGFSRRYPDAPVIRLTRDYRSTPQVVSLANRILTTRTGRLAPGAVMLEAMRPSSVPVRFSVYDDDVAEAEGTTARIVELKEQGVPLSEIAVLFRTNSQSEVFEDALARAGIGYVLRGGERFFARPEVRQAVLTLRAVVGVEDDGVALPDLVRKVLAGIGWTETPPAGRGAVRERWDSLNTLVNLADELYASRGASLPDMVRELEDRAEAQNAPTQDGVTLASLHSAKGLEWDAVFLAGVSDGLLPISMAETPEQVAEERRLLYVGVTRAREHLELSYARARTVGARGNRRHTRFLTGIWPEEDGGSPRRSTRPKKAASPDEVGDADLALFEILREWRTATARASGKPAYTVLHDTTLAAIATAKPRDLRQLALLRGIGATKLELYGSQILALVRGDHS